MASAATHIILAQSVFPLYFEGKNRRKFFVGTSFPDIRYLGSVERQSTHFQHVHLNTLLHENAFIAGLKFHSLVDDVRNQFLESKQWYYSFPRSVITVGAIKLLEDEILYEEVKNWREYVEFFNGTVEEEFRYGISNEDLFRWHQGIREYINHKPDDMSRAGFIQWIGYSRKVADEVNECIGEMRQNPELISTIHDLYRNFKYLVSHF